MVRRATMRTSSSRPRPLPAPKRTVHSIHKVATCAYCAGIQYIWRRTISGWEIQHGMSSIWLPI